MNEFICMALKFIGPKMLEMCIRDRGLAVITPDFTARPGNKTGCPSVLGVSLPSETGGRERIREGIFTAVNSARLDARTDDVEALVAYVKTITDKPIILSGHSEGGRTVYHYDKVDSRIIGMAIHLSLIHI